MNEKSLDKLEATARFSGFSRIDGAAVVLRLIEEIRDLRQAAPALRDEIHAESMRKMEDYFLKK